MPKRITQPILRVVVEFQITSPQPEKITKKMVDKIHELLREEVDEGMFLDMVDSGMVAKYVRTTRMV